jgi:DNA-directed RNA polymerase subunit F
MQAAHKLQTTNNIMDEILRRTENVTNQKPSRVKYFSKLGVLMIEASTSFIQKLIENPEIATAALAAEDEIYKI